MPTKQRLYWDSCVFLALISNRKDEQSVERRRICSMIFDRALKDELEIITSVITLTEVLKADDTDPVPEDIKEQIARLFDQSCITLVVSPTGSDIPWW